MLFMQDRGLHLLDSSAHRFFAGKISRTKGPNSLDRGPQLKQIVWWPS